MDKIWVIILGIAAMGGMICLDLLVSRWAKPKKEENNENKTEDIKK